MENVNVNISGDAMWIAMRFAGRTGGVLHGRARGNYRRSLLDERGEDSWWTLSTKRTPKTPA